MPGQPGLPYLTTMRGRQKGGATSPQASIPQGIHRARENLPEELFWARMRR